MCYVLAILCICGDTFCWGCVVVTVRLSGAAALGLVLVLIAGPASAATETWTDTVTFGEYNWLTYGQSLAWNHLGFPFAYTIDDAWLDIVAYDVDADDGEVDVVFRLEGGKPDVLIGTLTGGDEQLSTTHLSVDPSYVLASPSTNRFRLMPDMDDLGYSVRVDSATFGVAYESPGSGAPTPEPGTLALLAASAVPAVGRIVRRRRLRR